MPSTPTTNLRLELQATGENDDTWGTKNNINLQLLENAITKRQSVVLSSSNVTLSATNFADDQSRSLCLALTGVLTANVAVIVPTLSHLYIIDNRTTGAFSVTVRTAAGTGIVAPQNAATIAYVNATDVISLQSAAADAQTLDGLDSTEFARINAFNQFNKGNAHTFVAVADGATIDVQCPNGDKFIFTLGGNRTLQLNTPADGQEVELWVVQDGTGGRTLTFPANVVFPGGLTPTLTPSSGALDTFKLTYNLSRDQWVAQSNSGISGGSTVNITSTGNETNVNLFTRVGSPGGVVTVNYTISTGAILYSFDPETPALDLRGFANGSTINIINNGYILGAGGAGGDGAGLFDQGAGLSGAGVWSADAGQGGGNAVVGPGAAITVNFFNANGHVWGGGGGGGGGGASGPAAACVANGGGGGGGAGGALLGRGAKSSGSFVGTDGSRGSTGVFGTFGAGGAGAGSGATGGAGGNGGDWGNAGADGVQPAPSASNMAKGVGGPAGKAVELNGGAVTFVTGSGSPNVKGAVS